MEKNKIVQDFYEKLEAKGYKGKIVSAKLIPDLQRALLFDFNLILIYLMISI